MSDVKPSPATLDAVVEQLRLFMLDLNGAVDFRFFDAVMPKVLARAEEIVRAARSETAAPSVPADIVAILDKLHGKTNQGPWETRFYTGGGSTIAVPGGFLLPTDVDGHCLSSAEICFIVEIHGRWKQISAALKNAAPQGKPDAGESEQRVTSNELSPADAACTTAPSAIAPAEAYVLAIQQSVGSILSQHAANKILDRAKEISNGH